MTFEADYYQLLGINSDASDADIKKAFKKKAMELHPDKNQNDPKATEKFQQINEAYETLKDPVKKREYDLSHQKKKQTTKNSNDDIFEQFFTKRETFDDLISKLFGFSKRATSSSFNSSFHPNFSYTSRIDTAFIGGLPTFTSRGDLIMAFHGYNVIRAKVITKSIFKPAFGFVQFSSPENLRRVIRDRPNIMINGKICRVQESHTNFY